MLDIAWGELFVIGVIALIVLGPEDLPKALRKVGKASRQMRGMATQFRSQMDSYVQGTEFDDLRREVQELRATAQGFAHDTKRLLDPGPIDADPNAPAAGGDLWDRWEEDPDEDRRAATEGLPGKTASPAWEPPDMPIASLVPAPVAETLPPPVLDAEGAPAAPAAPSAPDKPSPDKPSPDKPSPG